MSDGQSIGSIKVPVGEVAAEAYRVVFGHFGLLCDLTWLPLLVQLAATLAPPIALYYLPPGSVAAPDYVVMLIEATAGIICVNAFVVRWYGVLLFPDRPAMPGALFLKAWARFIAYATLFAVLTMPSAIALSVSPETFIASSDVDSQAPAQNTMVALILTVAAVLAILVCLAIARLSLLFPAAAYGRPLGWSAAWRLMRGNTWRYIGCLLLTTMPFIFVVGFLETVTLMLTGATDVNVVKSVPGGILLDGLCDTAVLFGGGALAAAILAGFYRRLVLDRP